MNRFCRSLIVLSAGLCAPLAAAGAQGAADLFQQGVRKEQVEGNLPAAIAIYRRILSDKSSDRALLAKTLLQMGGAYEKLGSDQAKAAYRRVVREFSDQPGEFNLAQARLTALAPETRFANNTEPTVRRLWSGPTVDVLGAPTRDGHLLTFVDWSTGDLAIHDLTNGENRRITNKGPWTKSYELALFSVPSPDAKRVAYAWFNQQNKPELRVSDIDGSNTRIFYSNEGDDDAEPSAWTPDGRSVVAYVSHKNRTGEIDVIGVGDSSKRRVVTFDWRSPEKIAISPDGRFIAYDFAAGPVEGQHDIYLVPVGGGSPVTIVKHPANDQLLAWQPNGAAILFASDRAGSLGVWLQSVRNGTPVGEPRLVRRDAELTLFPLGMTDKGTFLYAASPAPVDLFVAGLDPATGKATSAASRLLDRNPGANKMGDWSPDGRRVAYLSQRRPGIGNSTLALVIHDLVTGEEKLPPLKLTNLAAPHWSRDGSYLLLSGKDLTGAQGIFRVDPETGAERLIVKGGNRQFLGLSADGKSIVYVQRDFPRKTFGIVSQSVDGGQPADIYRINAAAGQIANISEGAISADGSAIAFAQVSDTTAQAIPGFGRQVIKLLSSAGGEPKDIYVGPSGRGIHSLSWSADGKYVLFAIDTVVRGADGSLSPDATNEPIMRVSVSGGTAEPMGINGDEIGWIRPSPDGRQILFTAGKTSWEIWAMENFFPPEKRVSATRSVQRN